VFKHCEVAIAILDENDPNSERSFAFKRNQNASIACCCKLYKTKKQAAKQTTLEDFFFV
jgi:hypothetical protein